MVRDRPIIKHVSRTVSSGGVFVLETTDAVSTFVLIRLTCSGGLNDNLRILLEPKSVQNTSYTLKLPLLFPGTYFVFVTDEKGLRSIAEPLSVKMP